jgi:hypothetical protein
MDRIAEFLNIKYEGERFSSGRLPLDVLADLEALEDILTTFAREIWLGENDRERMPNGYTDWFRMSLTGVGDGSALPRLELAVVENSQQDMVSDDTRRSLMLKAEEKFAAVLKSANDGSEIILSGTQIRNFNRFLTNLKPGELFKYNPDKGDDFSDTEKVVSLDVERRKRFLTSVTTSYEQRIQGRARLKAVDERGTLRFSSVDLREFSVVDDSREPNEYGANIGAYYEFDLTVERRHDDSIQTVITIHDLSLLEDPAITAIDEMSLLQDGWLDGFGKEISSETRDNAKTFLVSSNRLPAFYAVAPTEDGGILLEYDREGWDYGIEFYSDGTYSVFGIDLNSEDEFSKSFSSGEFKSFLAMVKETLGQ